MKKYTIKHKKTGAILFSSPYVSQRDDYFATSFTLHKSMGGTDFNFNFEVGEEEVEDKDKVVNIIDSSSPVQNEYIPHYSDEELREMFEAENEHNYDHPLLKIEEDEV